jgi:hypothetical protein
VHRTAQLIGTAIIEVGVVVVIIGPSASWRRRGAIQVLDEIRGKLLARRRAIASAPVLAQPARRRSARAPSQESRSSPAPTAKVGEHSFADLSYRHVLDRWKAAMADVDHVPLNADPTSVYAHNTDFWEALITIAIRDWDRSPCRNRESASVSVSVPESASVSCRDPGSGSVSVSACRDRDPGSGIRIRDPDRSPCRVGIRDPGRDPDRSLPPTPSPRPSPSPIPRPSPRPSPSPSPSPRPEPEARTLLSPQPPGQGHRRRPSPLTHFDPTLKRRHVL